MKKFGFLALALGMSLALGCGEETQGSTGAACTTRMELTREMFVGGETLPAGTCWTADGAFRIEGGTLTIEEGVSIWFASGSSVTVRTGGQLRIAGTEEMPVELSTADPLVSWQGIRFDASQGSENVWEHVLLENAGDRNWTGAADSEAALYLNGATTLSTTRLTIAKSRGYALHVEKDVTFTFEQGVLTENERVGIFHPNVVGNLDSTVEVTDNTVNTIDVVFGNNDDVGDAQTWLPVGEGYVIKTRFFVSSVLTLEAGTRLVFDAGASLELNSGGQIVAIGTASSPVVLTGVEPTRGFWKGVRVQGGASGSLDHTVVEYAGGDDWTGASDTAAALYLETDASLTITNSTLRESANYALIARGGASIEGFAGNTVTANAKAMHIHPDRVAELDAESTYAGNTDGVVTVVLSNNDRVNTDATWKSIDVPYLISDRFFVEANLTIEPGAQLTFAQNVQMIISQDSGTLSVEGTAEAPVKLFGAEATSGYWTGIRFASNSPSNVISHATFSHGGARPWTGNADSVGTIYVEADAQISLSDVVIEDAEGYGVTLASDSAVISCSNVTSTASKGTVGIVGNGAVSC